MAGRPKSRARLAAEGNPVPPGQSTNIVAREARKGKKRVRPKTSVVIDGTYRPDLLPLVRKACEFGATDWEIAQVLGIGRTTLYEWRLRYPDLAKAMIVGKEAADARVERSLYERATGYSFESEKIGFYEGSPTRVAITEHVPPDPAAQKLWLTNRKGDKWKDKQETNLTVQPVVIDPDAAKF